jgi:hypothetical protein
LIQMKTDDLRGIIGQAILGQGSHLSQIKLDKLKKPNEVR